MKKLVLAVLTAATLITTISCLRLSSAGNRAAQEVVLIEVFSLESGQARRGTGWWHDGKIYTAGHMFWGFEEETLGAVVQLSDGEVCHVVAAETAQTADVAVLIPDCKHRGGFKIARGKPAAGDKACYTHMKGGSPVEICGEITSAVGQWIVMNIGVEHGHSGSPLYNESGRVIGIVVRGSDNFLLALRIEALEVGP